MRSQLVTVCLALCAHACHAGMPSSETGPRPRAAITVLRDARVIDGTGAAPREHTSVVIEGERIRWVGPDSELVVPAHAQQHSLTGKTLVPGLISAHSHLGMVSGTSVNAANGTRANILQQLAQYEAYGVTTVTSLGFNGSVFYALAPELHRGALPGADIFGADRGIGLSLGAPPVEAGPANLQRVDSEQSARAAVDEAAARHPDLIKIWVDDFRGSLPKMDPSIYRAIIDQAHSKQLRVAAHVFYLEDAKLLVAAGVDMLAHGVRDRPVDEELIAGLRERGVWYVPTLGLDETFYLYAREPQWLKRPFLQHALSPALRAQLEDPAWREKILADTQKLRVDEQAALMNQRNLRALYEAGVAIGFGTDSGATPLRIPGFAEHRELQLMVSAGLTPSAALRIATSQTAELLGLGDRGRIAAGLLADLIVVNGDPTHAIDALSRIEAVWHRGQRVRDAIEAFTP